MSKLFYPAIFTKEENSFWVRFPDLDGCFSEGETLEEAYEAAQEALGLYLQNENGFSCPVPCSAESLTTAKNETIVLVEFDPVAYLKRNGSKSVKKTLTIPEWLNILAEEKEHQFLTGASKRVKGKTKRIITTKRD